MKPKFMFTELGKFIGNKIPRGEHPGNIALENKPKKEEGPRTIADLLADESLSLNGLMGNFSKRFGDAKKMRLFQSIRGVIDDAAVGLKMGRFEPTVLTTLRINPKRIESGEDKSPHTDVDTLLEEVWMAATAAVLRQALKQGIEGGQFSDKWGLEKIEELVDYGETFTKRIGKKGFTAAGLKPEFFSEAYNQMQKITELATHGYKAALYEEINKLPDDYGFRGFVKKVVASQATPELKNKAA